MTPLPATLPMCRKRCVLITSSNFRLWDVDLKRKKEKKNLLRLCDLIIPRWRSGGRRLLHTFIYIYHRAHAPQQKRVLVMANTWPRFGPGVALSFCIFKKKFHPSVIFMRQPGKQKQPRDRRCWKATPLGTRELMQSRSSLMLAVTEVRGRGRVVEKHEP